MFSFAVDLRFLRVVAISGSAVGLVACGTSDQAAAMSQNGSAASSDPAPRVAAPEVANAAAGDVMANQSAVEPLASDGAAGEAAGEVPGEEAAPECVHGRWRVVDVAGGASAIAMMGRALSFTDAALGWAGSDGKVPTACSNPFHHVITELADVRAFTPAFTTGWARFKLPPARVGAMHAWEGGDGAAIFGPAKPAAGSLFYPVGSDGIVLNWNNGAVLRLRRTS